MSRALTRYAPTPSGYLHAGNVANFRHTATLAQEVGASIALRIDDADAARYRREYVEDIFAVLAARDLPWEIGPRDVSEFEAHFSQCRRTEYYRAELRSASINTYVCTCSRSIQHGPPTGGCAGGCRHAGTPWRPGETALRAVVPEGTLIAVGPESVRLDEALGDFIVWRRDDLPAYQWVSVIEDRDLGTTHIVRGADLLPSTAAQIFLARAIGARNVAEATYVHHDLVLDAHGTKLSKSTLRSQEER